MSVTVRGGKRKKKQNTKPCEDKERELVPSHGELRREGEGREGTESSVSMFLCVCARVC